MRALIAAAAALVVLPLSVSAQQTAQFRSRAGGGLVSGTESYTIADTPSGHEVTATVAVKRGGAQTDFTLQESLDAGWAAVKYLVEVTGATGNATATAERKGDSLLLAVKTPTASPTLNVPAGPRLILMESLVAAPYQVLLNLTGGKPGPVSVVVPFQLAMLDGTLEAAGTAPGTLDGKPIVATRLLLKVAGLTTEIDFDATTKQLLRVFTSTPPRDSDLVRVGFEPAGSAAPPAAEPPAGVSERLVTFKQIDGAPYPAVLCLPKNPVRPPLVVMLGGSGPNDRDETIGPNKPFRDLAWGLAGQGVATLRFDKRTFAFPKSYKGSLDSESIDDGVDAVTFAGTLGEVDRNRIYVLGHSLGGLAAIYVAERVPVAGIILMATAGRPMDQVIRDQVKEAAAGQDEAKQMEVLNLQDSIMAKVRAGTATAQELNGQPPGAIRDMIVRDPIAELQKTKAPLLVLRGAKDAQMFQADFDALAAVAARRPGSASMQFPNLTHLFTPTDGPATFQAIYQPGHVPPEVADTIAAWIAKSGAK